MLAQLDSDDVEDVELRSSLGGSEMDDAGEATMAKKLRKKRGKKKKASPKGKLKGKSLKKDSSAALFQSYRSDRADARLHGTMGKGAKDRDKSPEDPAFTADRDRQDDVQSK